MEETGANSYGKRPLWQWILIYAVIGGIIYAALYYFVFAKKGGYNYTQPSPYTSPTVAPSPTESAMMKNEMSVKLAEENKSGESGTAMLKEENGKTTVTIDLTGFTTGVAQPAHIHVGSCPGVGAVKYPLTNVLDGKSVTVLSVTIDELKKQLPLAINVHKSEKEIAMYTACGGL